MIAMCLLASVAMGQGVPAPAPNAVPSLVVSIVGQQGNSYDVKVVNRSGHAVTAFALRLASADGGQNCDGSCGRAETVADNARPAIKAGGSVDLGLSSSRVNIGMVAAEAAVFDDESYQGDERAAALLVAQQIGRQAEYDRLIAAANGIMITNAGDAHKTTQIRSKLAELSVGLDPAMVQTFKRWFPALAGCMKQYARFMKAAATNERQLVAGSMAQFAQGRASGTPSLTQWWSAMQQQLAPFGCNGCAAQAMRPKTPSSQNVAQPCREDIMPVLLTASLADDGSMVDSEEEMEAELSDEDEAALDASIVVPETRIPSGTPARFIVVEKDVPPAEPTPPPKPVAAARPAEIPMADAADGKGYLFERTDFQNRPVPDYLMYQTFFRDISNFGDMALYEVVRRDKNGQRVENLGPRAGGLKDAEIAILKQAAAETNRQLRGVFTKKDALIRAKVLIYPPGWMFYAPPITGLHALDLQETQTLKNGIQRLRSKLGPASFARLDGFVRSVYHATPGKLVLRHLTGDSFYTQFFHYLALLDGMPGNLTAQQEEVKRQNELGAAGLAKKDWALLVGVAKDYEQLYDRLYNPIPQETRASIVEVSIGPPTPLKEAVAYPGSVLLGAQPTHVAPVPMVTLGEVLHSNPIMLHEPLAAMPLEQPTLGVITLSPEARRKEYERKHDELDLALITGIAQVQAGFGEARFQKFEAYLHQLYADSGTETAVPIEAKKVKAEKPQAQRKKGQDGKSKAHQSQRALTKS
jgi:hypothetical protein